MFVLNGNPRSYFNVGNKYTTTYIPNNPTHYEIKHAGAASFGKLPPMDDCSERTLAIGSREFRNTDDIVVDDDWQPVGYYTARRGVTTYQLNLTDNYLYTRCGMKTLMNFIILIPIGRITSR